MAISHPSPENHVSLGDGRGTTVFRQGRCAYTARVMRPTVDTDVSQRLLDAAERLFYERGVQAVGVDAVVAEAGVATKTLYARFGSKDGLVEAYLRRRDQRWLNWLHDA